MTAALATQNKVWQLFQRLMQDKTTGHCKQSKRRLLLSLPQMNKRTSNR